MDITKRAEDAAKSVVAHLKYMHDHEALVLSKAQAFSGLDTFEGALESAGVKDEVDALRDVQAPADDQEAS